MTLSTTPRRVLLADLAYQTAPGAHTASLCECLRWRRGTVVPCERCIDAELLRRGYDVTVARTGYRYERVRGRVRRVKA